MGKFKRKPTKVQHTLLVMYKKFCRCCRQRRAGHLEHRVSVYDCFTNSVVSDATESTHNE